MINASVYWGNQDMVGNSCTFCRIAGRKSPASYVYEEERVMAILDIRPENKGHTLVVPKTRYETVFGIPDSMVAHLYKVVRRVAWAVKKGVSA